MNLIFIKIAAVLALIVGLYFAEQHVESLGYDRAKAEDHAATETLKREAEATLASETTKTRTAEQALQDFKNTQELQDVDHQKTVADLSDRLHRAAAGNAGRLRDPHAAGCGAGGGSAPGQAASAPGLSSGDRGEAGGLLSKSLSDLLFRITSEADTINVAYASCRADAFAVRAPH